MHSTPWGGAYDYSNEEICRKIRSLMENLKEKEKIIAGYTAKGMTARQIADAMCLSPETIKWYRKRMLSKANATNMAELIAMLKDEGVL